MVEVRDAFASDSASRRFSAFDEVHSDLWQTCLTAGAFLTVPSVARHPGFREIGHRGIHRGALIRCGLGSSAADERAAAAQLDPLTVPALAGEPTLTVTMNR